MPSTAVANESKPGTAAGTSKERRVKRPRPVGHQAHSARPEGTRPPSDFQNLEAVPTVQNDNVAAQAPSGRSYPRLYANALGLLGLATVAGGGWAAAAMGDLDVIRQFISQSSGFITYSASGPAYDPSVYGFLGLAFSGSFGVIFACSLGICACLGMMALRADRGATGLLGKALPLMAALLVPMLALNYTIFLAVEKAGAYLMPVSLLDNPGQLGFWVAAALIGAAAIGLTSNGLMLRWAWRREQRLAA